MATDLTSSSTWDQKSELQVVGRTVVPAKAQRESPACALSAPRSLWLRHSGVHTLFSLSACLCVSLPCSQEERVTAFKSGLSEINSVPSFAVSENIHRFQGLARECISTEQFCLPPADSPRKEVSVSPLRGNRLPSSWNPRMSLVGKMCFVSS